VIAESYERIHRSNLVAWASCRSSSSPAIRADARPHREEISHRRHSAGIKPGMKLTSSGRTSFRSSRRSTRPPEVEYLLAGGILQYVLRSLAGEGVTSRIALVVSSSSGPETAARLELVIRAVTSTSASSNVTPTAGERAEHVLQDAAVEQVLDLGGVSTRG